ncbi:MAG: metallophosphoesterase, partial [Burkholderiales bacterium]
MIGDSGCRIKGAELQDCSDTDAAWPFGRVAAATRPDLVIHVGDYHYRESPCPADRACRESPWGYGWDAWQADYFAPAAPLLAAAPWVMVRGNHEECNRAGQGWSRLLAPERYSAQRSCDDPANDEVADFSPPYAVPLGGDTQLLVFDSAHAGNARLKPGVRQDDLILANYRAEMNELAALSERPGMRSWFVSHHPVLAFAPDEHRPKAPYPGNQALQAA